MKKQLMLTGLLIICSLPSILSLLQPGFFQSDDGEWMIIRFSAFYQAFADGQFPIRFLGRLNHGYGYPVANFLYPGFMYVGLPIKLLGFGLVATIKIILGLSMLASAIFTYLWLSKLFDRFSSLLGALFYLYTPYHLYDVYKRGSVGEVLALAIVPFVLWQMERKSLFWLPIGIAILILSHNTLALLFLPIIAIYMIMRVWSSSKRSQQIYQYTSILALGVGLAAFFWIPAVFELQYTRFQQVTISDPTTYFASLKLIGASSFGVLIALILSVFFKVRPWPKSHVAQKQHLSYVVLFLTIGIGGVFFSSQMSSSFWIFTPSSLIQFPFRLLSLLILSVAFLSAYTVSSFTGFNRYFVTSIFLLSLLISSFPYLGAKILFDKGDSYYATNEATTNVQDEYIPIWVKQKPTEHFKEKVEIVEGKGDISNLAYNPSKIVTFDVFSQVDAKVRINTIYYPGWRAYVDRKETEIDYSNEKGVMDIRVGKGTKNIELLFTETPLRVFADTISFVSLFFLILWFVRFRPSF